MLFRSIEMPFSAEEIKGAKADDLTDKIFEAAMESFKRKNDRLADVANPVIEQVFENQGKMYENILIPITDGKRMYNVSCNLKEAYDTKSKSIVKAFQKSILLHTIDDAWKEHLRDLDQLRQSVKMQGMNKKILF